MTLSTCETYEEEDDTMEGAVDLRFRVGCLVNFKYIHQIKTLVRISNTLDEVLVNALKRVHMHPAYDHIAVAIMLEARERLPYVYDETYASEIASELVIYHDGLQVLPTPLTPKQFYMRLASERCPDVARRLQTYQFMAKEYYSLISWDDDDSQAPTVSGSSTVEEFCEATKVNAPRRFRINLYSASSDMMLFMRRSAVSLQVDVPPQLLFAFQTGKEWTMADGKSVSATAMLTNLTSAMSSPMSCCNLINFCRTDEMSPPKCEGAINLSRLCGGGNFRWLELDKVCAEFVTDMCHVKEFDVAVHGLFDAFQELGYEVESEQARAFNKRVFERILYRCIERSISLSDDDDATHFFSHVPTNDPPHTTMNWDILQTQLATRSPRHRRITILNNMGDSPSDKQAVVWGTTCGTESNGLSYGNNMRRLLVNMDDMGVLNKVNRKILKDTGSVATCPDLSDGFKRRHRTLGEMPVDVLIQMASDRARFLGWGETLVLPRSVITLSTLAHCFTARVKRVLVR